MEVAARSGIDLSGFNPNFSLGERFAWANAQRLGIAAVLSRYSSKMQHRTQSQIRDIEEFHPTVFARANARRRRPTPCTRPCAGGRCRVREQAGRRTQALREPVPQASAVR